MELEVKVLGIAAHRGFMLITVLVIAAIGLLFGAGALLLFRYQCQMRIDRQHDLEKVYAVRSALNYIRTYDDNTIDERNVLQFGYHTASERDLKVLVKPVKTIFPAVTNGGQFVQHHFVMDRGDFTENPVGTGEYVEVRDYEYGVEGATNVEIRTVDYQAERGLKFGNLTESNNVVRWWINIGMLGTGGWLKEDYGRRYFFYPAAHVNNKDVMRFCIVRNVTHNKKPGWEHGWPLSNGERALMLEIRPKGVADEADVTLFECYAHGAGSTDGRLPMETNTLIRLDNYYTRRYIGFQIAHDKIAVFNIENAAKDPHPISVRGYDFSAVVNLSLETYEYFKEGCVVDPDGNIKEAPDLRAVFEVEADPNLRGKVVDKGQLDFLTKFRVTPAYQYDLFLEYPEGSEPKLATVAQKVGEWNRKGTSYSVLTYDTHGTDNKGFRKDEKEWAEKKGGGN